MKPHLLGAHITNTIYFQRRRTHNTFIVLAYINKNIQHTYDNISNIADEKKYNSYDDR
jgi:hypothetical protein